jgi:3-deoxy-D-manno-oct-2-ulosonic acid (Kdo) hydroxylase
MTIHGSAVANFDREARQEPRGKSSYGIAMDRSDALETFLLTNWTGPFAPETQRSVLAALEAGKVVAMPNLAFGVEAAEKKFLSPSISGDGRKNISLDPTTREISNTKLSGEESKALAAMIDRFGRSAHQLLRDLLPTYAPRLIRARTSYRPNEIAGRAYSPRKDDTRLHVDAFPSRPSHGQRILRFFANIADDGAPRHWRVGEPFQDFARKFASRVKAPPPGSAWLLSQLGITKGKRSAYDHYMLRLHDLGKLDADYQAKADKLDVNFNSGSVWFCFTDQVLHAALSGHAALEQTFYVPVEAMTSPSTAPLRVLETLTGRTLA